MQGHSARITGVCFASLCSSSTSASKSSSKQSEESNDGDIKDIPLPPAAPEAPTGDVVQPVDDSDLHVGYVATALPTTPDLTLEDASSSSASSFDSSSSMLSELRLLFSSDAEGYVVLWDVVHKASLCTF
jgi:hypothetical protein